MARRAHNQEKKASRRGVSTAAGLTLVASVATLIGGFVLADVEADHGPGAWQPQSTLPKDVGKGLVPLQASTPPGPVVGEGFTPSLASAGHPTPSPEPHPAHPPAMPAPAAPAPQASPATPPAPAPTTAVALLGNDRAQNPQTLRGWIADPELPPEVRYAALRRLEQVDAELGLETALTLLSDRESLVRLNAVVMVSRSDDPSAADALAQLDPRTRFLARRLAARR